MLMKRWFAPLIVLALAVLFLLGLPAMLGRPELRESLQLSIVYLLAAAVPYLLLCWVTLRVFDILAGIQFKGNVYDKLERDPAALARYLGARVLAVFLGLAVVVGYVLASVRF